jgi:hypothetical protein
VKNAETAITYLGDDDSKIRTPDFFLDSSFDLASWKV